MLKENWVCYEKNRFNDNYDFAGLMFNEEEAKAWVAEKPNCRYYRKGMPIEV